MKTQESKIAIIGAGPAGATMGAVLQKHGIAFHIFERETELHARDQGGSLDMKDETGQEALRLAGAHAEFLRLSRPEGQEVKLIHPNGEILFEDQSGQEDGYMPEIDRGQLRQILLNKIPKGRISWNKGLQSVTSLADGRQEILFLDGSRETFDLVVGADGAWSKIRPLLSAAKPLYSGVTFIELEIRDITRRHPELFALTGSGKMFSPGTNKTIITQMNDEHSLRMYFALRVPEAWHEALKGLTALETRNYLKTEFAGFSPRLLALLDACEDKFIPRLIHALPYPHSWSHKQGLTLLGDSAHLMSPFSGMGANLAMYEGAELAELIAASSDLDEAVRAFEARMIPRGAKFAEGADEGVRSAVAPDALAGIVEHFKSVMTKQDA